MRQSQPVVQRDTSDSRQTQTKEGGGRAPVVTRPPLCGSLVPVPSPPHHPGPITHIHIQKLQQPSVALGTHVEAAEAVKAVHIASRFPPLPAGLPKTNHRLSERNITD